MTIQGLPDRYSTPPAKPVAGSQPPVPAARPQEAEPPASKEAASLEKKDSVEGLETHRSYELTQQVCFDPEVSLESPDETGDIQELGSLEQEVQVWNEAMEIYNTGDFAKAAYWFDILAEVNNEYAKQMAQKAREKQLTP